MNEVVNIQNLIYEIRGIKVMLDSDLAKLYGVETKRLNEAVKRNVGRFPKHYMFQLTEEEFVTLRSQIATSKEGKGGRRYMPYVFSEQGVAMLSSVLNSEVAIQMNIRIIDTFVYLLIFRPNADTMHMPYMPHRNIFEFHRFFTNGNVQKPY